MSRGPVSLSVLEKRTSTNFAVHLSPICLTFGDYSLMKDFNNNNDNSNNNNNNNNTNNNNATNDK
ncbi:hypothetical protein E2C01_018023 [Portunus trituberculatus]|uniref:Uncharacterized protein n=1 Tax=Portunus trituberculatus TaxID=210409 RepID=A0A5B7DV41_PORTR|nr:hypothetical protein [Portunus trituberculatus]